MISLWSGSVTKDEGLRSPKAIAFILNKCSPNRSSLITKTYSANRAILIIASNFVKARKNLADRLIVPLMKKFR
jgi:hypothetical protein